MNRRNFIKSASALTIYLLAPVKFYAGKTYKSTVKIYKHYLQKIIELINSLKKEKSNLVLKIMDGKKYVFDPYYHYPWQGGILDEKTGSRIFFHAHRKNEYGHFHTFINDENGDLVHLVLISMNKDGYPTGLSTVNTWVTGDKYVEAAKLKKLLDSFKMNPENYKDERVIQFIELMFKSYKDVIYKLFDERDEWIENYTFKYTKEPFEDRNYEVLSSKEINIYEDIRT